jgi:hypothetical protein
MLIVIVQPLLILRGSKVAHRMIGRSSLAVALAFVLSGLLLAHFRVNRMSDATFVKDGIYIYLPLAFAMLFAAACALGVRWRSSSLVHARFMLSTALLMIDPVVSRIMSFYMRPLPSEHLYQGITFSLTVAVMAYLTISLPQQTPGRIWYRNYCLGTTAIFALFFAVPYTGTWLGFVRWFRALPLT